MCPEDSSASSEVRYRRPDFGRRSPPRGPWLLLGPAAAALGVVILLFIMANRLSERAGSVVVYTSQDQVYAEPILRGFERRTGIRARAVLDSEAVKTVGLANRLLAERARPQCDVFWNNEALRTRQLIAAGVLSDAEPPVELGYRSRRLVLNTNLVPLAQAPRSIVELTNVAWAGRVALAYPLFGTTATHLLALRQHWGETAWSAWCRALRANRPFVVDGNSVVVRLVGQGEAWVGLTDSDDIAAGRREGYPIMALPLTPESLLIPNTAAIVEGAPHPALAREFLEYLRRPDVVDTLVQANALEGSSAAQVPGPTLQPDWQVLLRDLEPATETLEGIFLR